MSKPHNVCFAKQDDNGKTHWKTIGVAFPTKNNGLSVIIETLPVNLAAWDGKFCIFPPKSEYEQGGGDNYSSDFR